MQRKYLTSIVLILFLSIIGTVLYFTFQKLHKKKLARDNIEYMPDISFFDIANNNHFNIKKNSNEYSTCLIQIDPNCHFCNKQVKDILKDHNRFHNITILLVSTAHEDILKEYYTALNLNRYPNLYLLSDRNLVFPKTFGTSTTPTTILYEKGGRFISKFEGIVKIGKIINEFKD